MILTQEQYKKLTDYWSTYTDLDFFLGKNWENNKNLDWIEDNK